MVADTTQFGRVAVVPATGPVAPVVEFGKLYGAAHGVHVLFAIVVPGIETVYPVEHDVTAEHEV